MQTNAHALRRKAAFFFTAPRRHRKRRALPGGQRARLSKTNSSNNTHWMWCRFWPQRHTSIKTWIITWTAAKTMASFINVTFCLFHDVKNDRTGSSDCSVLVASFDLLDLVSSPAQRNYTRRRKRWLQEVSFDFEIHFVFFYWKSHNISVWLVHLPSCSCFSSCLLIHIFLNCLCCMPPHYWGYLFILQLFQCFKSRDNAEN